MFVLLPDLVILVYLAAFCFESLIFGLLLMLNFVFIYENGAMLLTDFILFRFGDYSDGSENVREFALILLVFCCY